MFLLVSLSSKRVVNGCNTEEVIEPTTECIISCVAFSTKKRGATVIKTNSGVESKEVKVPYEAQRIYLVSLVSFLVSYTLSCTLYICMTENGVNRVSRSVSTNQNHLRDPPLPIIWTFG